MMPLAALNFAFPLMLLVGLLAAGIPVLLHLLNRIRSPIVPFPTLRFLKITAQKTSRRRQLQQWLLLLLRMALFAMLGMAVAGPAIGGGSLAFAYGTVLMLLLGLGFVAMTVVLITTAMDKAKAKAGPVSAEDLVAQSRAQTAEEKASAITQHRPGRYWGLSAVSAILALALAGFATYAFASNTFFSHNSGGFSGRSTACVIILDNSQSMLARQAGASRLQRAQSYIRQMLLETIRPAEAALVLTNPATDDSAALTAEPSKILARFDALESLGRAVPMRDRVQKALDLLRDSPQANKLLVVVSDFQHDAFSDVETFAKVSDVPALQVAMLTLGAPATPDLGITRFEVDSGQPAVGSEITFSTEIVNNADTLAPRVDLDFLVDDQVVQHLQLSGGVQPGRDGKASAKIAYRLQAPGWHRFGLRFSDQPATESTEATKANADTPFTPGYQDAIDWNNQRQISLRVKDQIRVLVIGGQDRPRYRSAAYFTMAALAPFDGVKTPAGTPKWSLAPTYRGVAAVDTRSLPGYDAVFLCDVPRVTPELAAALKSYVSAGKRLIIQTGPGVDVANYNAILCDKAGLLPSQLKEPVISAEGARIDYVDVSKNTAVFADLYDSLEPFQRIVVTGRWSLATEAGNVLWKLSDNAPAIVRHPVGPGDVYLMLTVPASDWSNFSTQPAFVAAMNRLAQGELGNSRATRSIETGSPIRIAVDAEQPLRILLTSPDSKTNEIVPTADVPPNWLSPAIYRPGVWRWESKDGALRGLFVANVPGNEADLTKADEEALAGTIKTADAALVARTPEELLTRLKREDRSLMPGVLAMVTILLVFEALMANRYRPAVRVAESALELPEPAAA